MSTLRVSNIEAKADASSPTIDEKVKVTSSQGRVLVQIDGKTAGITSIGINTTSTSFTIDANQNVQFVGVITAANVNTSGTISIGRTDTTTVNTIRSVTDINSWEYGGVSLAVGGQDTSPQDIYFKDDGLKMYVVGSAGNEVNEYSLSTAWDVSTAGFTTVFSTASQDTGPLGLYFKPDGSRMYICGNAAVSPANADQVRSYTLSTPWSIASGSVTYDNKAFTTTDTSPQGVYFKDDGLKMYVVGATVDAVYEYSLSTAWELDSTITLLNTVLLGTTNTLNLPLSLTAPTGIDFNASGTKMYITDNIRDVVARFDLSTPWDTTTISFYDNVYVGFQELAPAGIFYQEDQSKAYIVGSSSDTVFQYNIDVPSLELASSGISTRSSVIINNEARLNNRLYVTGDAHVSSNTNLKGTLTVDGASTLTGNVTASGTLAVTSTLTASAALTASTTTSAINLGTSQTTGTLILGGTAQTGTITIGRVTTASQTTDIQAAATTSGNQKTINLGTGGLSGSRTLITVGSQTVGAISTVTIPPPTNLGLGTVAPVRKFHLYGNQAEFLIEDPSNTVDSNRLNLYISGDKANFRMLNQAGTGGTVFLQGDSSGNVTLPTAGSSILNSSGRKILNQTGGILQVVSVNKTDEYFLSGTGTPTDVPGLSVSITPSSTSSQILILGHVNYSATSGGGDSFARLMRGATAIGSGVGGYFGQVAGQDYYAVNPNVIFLVDSPATTSSTTYKIQVWGQSLYVNSRGLDGSFDTSSQIVLMEIAG